MLSNNRTEDVDNVTLPICLMSKCCPFPIMNTIDIHQINSDYRSCERTHLSLEAISLCQLNQSVRHSWLVELIWFHSFGEDA